MRDAPRLTDASIVAALQRAYGLEVAALTFLPLGNDLASVVYRVEAEDGTSYLLKGRAGQGFGLPSLLVPHFLAKQGIPHVLAPLPTRSGSLWERAGNFALSLYPFLDSRTAADAGLSGEQWHALGATLRQIHESALPHEVNQPLPRETFTPSRRDVLRALDARLATDTPTDPAQRELAAFWHAHQEEIGWLIHRADTLGAALRHAPPPSVLCHADLHGWNVLLDRAGGMWIVDWDETILAPKERDLMFVIGGIGHDLVRPHESEQFLRGYGSPTVDPRALGYYRYAWAVQDMGAYAEALFFAPHLGEPDRQEALLGFLELFAPGNIVDIARATDSMAE